MPKIQEILREYLGDLQLGTHLNGDESMAKGAAFAAANYSSSFRVMPILMSDGLNVPINLEINTLDEDHLDDDEAPYHKSLTLMKPKTKFGTKKSLTFTYDKDLELKFTYPNEHGEPQWINSFEVSNISLIASREQYADLGRPKVHLKVKLNDLGLLEIVTAKATIIETKVIESEERQEVLEGDADYVHSDE